MFYTMFWQTRHLARLRQAAFAKPPLLSFRLRVLRRDKPASQGLPSSLKLRRDKPAWQANDEGKAEAFGELVTAITERVSERVSW
jgi:hypothetical protein